MTINKEHVKNAQRDINKFDKIYVHYADKIKNYLRSKVNNDEFTAEDLTSQTFEKALKNIGRFQWRGVSFSAWLYRIANNTLIDFYRKYKKNAEVSTEFYENLKDPSPLTEDLFVSRDTRNRIRNNLDKLNDREKEIILMKFYEDLNNKEIAEKLNISESNVGTIIYRAVNKLKQFLPDIR